MDFCLQELTQVGKFFGIKEKLTSYERISNGNVNVTYRVEFENDLKTIAAKTRKYIFQKLNTTAFKNVPAVMANTMYVTKCLFESGLFEKTLHCYHTCDENSQLFYKDGEAVWRVFDYIEGSVYNNVDDSMIVCETGRAFGKFQKALWDSKMVNIYETIPDFHNTCLRFDALYKAYEMDIAGRKIEASTEVEKLKVFEERACRLTKMQLAGQLPTRITHNDTKINNVVFNDTKQAIAVIDLDTVMPGLVAQDFGDGIRYAADGGRLGSGEVFRQDLFCEFTKGFLGEIGEYLSETEKETLYLAPFTMTVELSVRYLTDYLSGDKYFVVKEGKQNLNKARHLIELAEQMLEHELDIKHQIQKMYT